MSKQSTDAHDGLETSTLIDTNVVSSASSSKSPSPSTPSNTHSPPLSYKSNIDTPAIHPPSRPSLDSTNSELSELSIHSNEFQTTHPLIRSPSHDAAPPPPPSSPATRSRLRSALHSFYVANYGAMLVLLSQVFGAGMNIATRLLETPGSHGEPMHPFQILFARQSITAFLCTSYGIYTKAVPHFPFGAREVRWLLVIRGLCGFFGVFGLYFSLLYLPLSEATVLTFLGPILTCYLCSFVIPGQTFTQQQQLASFVSLVGVIFIAQPASIFKAITSDASSSSSSHPPTSPTDGFTTSANSTQTDSGGPQTPTSQEHLKAIGIAMIGVLGATGALTSIRAIGKRAHAFISINYFSVWCSIVSLVALIVFPDVKFRFPGNITEWALLLSLGVCGFCMQFLLTAGLAYGGARLKGDSGGVRPPFRDIEANDTTIPTSASTPDRRLSTEIDSQGRKSASQPRSSSSGTRATSMVYTQMLFALAGDKFVFGVTPGTMSWIGSVLILAGAVWVASARDKEEKPAHVSGNRSRSPHPAPRQSSKHADTATVEEAENLESTGLLYDVDEDDGFEHQAVKGSRRDGHGPVESVELRDMRS
ncbi:hypothetical protein B0A52_04987 [Exophiala mesophila]|uniref:EamA domain-containing protein n=1 Tax=Exophiala mesophila TaxID=212818 RepID=A0A438N6L4_EXOME|nr:hypothetical protein B0A52_04987 [Exophiala mesophila]